MGGSYSTGGLSNLLMGVIHRNASLGGGLLGGYWGVIKFSGGLLGGFWGVISGGNYNVLLYSFGGGFGVVRGESLSFGKKLPARIAV